MKNGKMHMLMVILLLVTVSPVFVRADGYEQNPQDHRTSDSTSFLFENETAVYAFDAGHMTMMYLDEDTMTWYPLCNRPECDHKIDAEPPVETDCNAFIDARTSNGMTEWDGRIFYFDYGQTRMETKIHLASMAPDGTDHRMDLAIEREQGEQVICMLHRGNAYVMRDYMGEKPYQIQRYDLNHLKDAPQIIWDNEGTEVFFPTFIGDEIYYMLSDGEYQKVCRMNLDGTNREVLAEQIHWGRTELSEKQLYQYMPDIGLYAISYETGEQTTLLSKEELSQENYTFSYDGEYFYLWSVDEMYRQTKDCSFLIVDSTGEIKEKMTIPDFTQAVQKLEQEMLQEEEKEEPDQELLAVMNQKYTGMMYSQCFVGVSSDYVFASDSFYPNYYLKRAEIGTGMCEWKPIENYFQ